MVDKSIYDNNRDLENEIFARLEEQVIDIKSNVSLLMMTLNNNIGLLK